MILKIGETYEAKITIINPSTGDPVTTATPKCQIKRKRDDKYWTGFAWSSTITNLDMTHIGDGVYSYSFTPPQMDIYTIICEDTSNSIKEESSLDVYKYDYIDTLQKEKLEELIDSFRVQIYDIDPELNILKGKALRYTDSRIFRFLKQGLKDLNSGNPKTAYTLYNFPDEELIVKGGLVKSLVAEGILQLNNQVDYSDSGFNVAMFNKTGAFQGWAGFFLQTYLQEKRDFKSGVVPRSLNSGFISISSEFGWNQY